VDPETKLAGNAQFTGPFMNEVVDPPTIPPVDVLSTESKFVVVVVKRPAIKVKKPVAEVETGVSNVTPAVPELFIVRLLKAVPSRDCAAVPLKVTVPLLGIKVPLFIQLPATFILAEDGPVKELEDEIVRLLNELVEEPLMVVVPSKLIVLVPAVNVPLLIQLPPTACV